MCDPYDDITFDVRFGTKWIHMSRPRFGPDVFVYVPEQTRGVFLWEEGKGYNTREFDKEDYYLFGETTQFTLQNVWFCAVISLCIYCSVKIHWSYYSWIDKTMLNILLSEVTYNSSVHYLVPLINVKIKFSDGLFLTGFIETMKQKLYIK